MVGPLPGGGDAEEPEWKLPFCGGGPLKSPPGGGKLAFAFPGANGGMANPGPFGGNGGGPRKRPDQSTNGR